MENIFEVPIKLTGLDAIPVPTTHRTSAEIVNSEAVNDTNANNLTEVQKVGIEKEIQRAIDNMGSNTSKHPTCNLMSTTLLETLNRWISKE